MLYIGKILMMELFID